MMKFFVGLALVICFFLRVSGQDIEEWGTRLSWSPDGEHLAIGFRSGSVEIRQGIDGRLIRTLDIPNDSFANDVDWSPVGDLFAAVAGDNHLYIWDTNTWDIVRTIEIEESGAVHTINWNDDNVRLAGLAQEGGSLYIWNIETGENLLSRTYGGLYELADFDWYGDYLALTIANSIGLMDIEGNLIEDVGFTGSYVTEVGSNYSNRLIASGTASGRIEIWDEITNKMLSNFAAHNPQSVFSLEWHPDCVHLASGGLDGDVTVWNTQTEQLITRIESSLLIMNVEWSPDGSQLAYTGIPRQVTDDPLWALISSDEIGILEFENACSM